MSDLSISDLRREFWGGGSDAEYEVLRAHYEAGRNAADMFSGGGEFIGARCYASGVQNIGSTGAFTVQFDTEAFDTADMWDAGTPNQLLIPEDGYYLFHASLARNSMNGQQDLGIAVAGATVAAKTSVGNGYLKPAVSTIAPAIAGQAVTAVGWTSVTGSTENGNHRTYLSAVKIG